MAQACSVTVPRSRPPKQDAADIGPGRPPDPRLLCLSITTPSSSTAPSRPACRLTLAEPVPAGSWGCEMGKPPPRRLIAQYLTFRWQCSCPRASPQAATPPVRYVGAGGSRGAQARPRRRARRTDDSGTMGWRGLNSCTRAAQSDRGPESVGAVPPQRRHQDLLPPPRPYRSAWRRGLPRPGKYLNRR